MTSHIYGIEHLQYETDTYMHQKTSVADIVDKKLLSFILLFGSVLRFDFTKFPMQFYRLIFVWGIAM